MKIVQTKHLAAAAKLLRELTQQPLQKSAELLEHLTAVCCEPQVHLTGRAVALGQGPCWEKALPLRASQELILPCELRAGLELRPDQALMRAQVGSG